MYVRMYVNMSARRYACVFCTFNNVDVYSYTSTRMCGYVYIYNARDTCAYVYICIVSTFAELFTYEATSCWPRTRGQHRARALYMGLPRLGWEVYAFTRTLGVQVPNRRYLAQTITRDQHAALGKAYTTLVPKSGCYEYVVRPRKDSDPPKVRIVGITTVYVHIYVYTHGF